jgi:hypothetical protein
MVCMRLDSKNLLKHRYSLIMPIAWVRSFWVPLVFAGGHAIGLRERHWLYTDVCILDFEAVFSRICQEWSGRCVLRVLGCDKCGQGSKLSGFCSMSCYLIEIDLFSWSCKSF